MVDLLSERPRTAGELARETSLSPPAASRRLKTLRDCGLVEDTHPTFDARVRIYALRAEPMANLRLWLETAERMWATQLAVFKAHVEGGAD